MTKRRAGGVSCPTGTHIQTFKKQKETKRNQKSRNINKMKMVEPRG
jgi:hypothetical protein